MGVPDGRPECYALAYRLAGRRYLTTHGTIAAHEAREPYQSSVSGSLRR